MQRPFWRGLVLVLLVLVALILLVASVLAVFGVGGEFITRLVAAYSRIEATTKGKPPSVIDILLVLVLVALCVSHFALAHFSRTIVALFRRILRALQGTDLGSIEEEIPTPGVWRLLFIVFASYVLSIAAVHISTSIKV